jgi:hypothetical protein
MRGPWPVRKGPYAPGVAPEALESRGAHTGVRFKESKMNPGTCYGGARLCPAAAGAGGPGH